MSLDTKFILDAISELFDKFDARWAKRDAARKASRRVPVPTQSAAVGADVVADNWGDLFDSGDDSDEQCYEKPIIADNWGGFFGGEDAAANAEFAGHWDSPSSNPDATACVTPEVAVKSVHPAARGRFFNDDSGAPLDSDDDSSVHDGHGSVLSHLLEREADTAYLSYYAALDALPDSLHPDLLNSSTRHGHGHLFLLDGTAWDYSQPHDVGEGARDSSVHGGGSSALSHLAPIRAAASRAPAPAALPNPHVKIRCRLVDRTRLSRDVRLIRFSLPSSDQALGLPNGTHVFGCASVDGKPCMRAYTPTSKEEEVLTTSPNRCLMNCFNLIHSCFSRDAVPHRQPWPPPVHKQPCPPPLLDLVSGSAAYVSQTSITSFTSHLATRVCVDWQPWSVLIPLEIFHVCGLMRPMPWPCFTSSVNYCMNLDARFVWKPPWSLQRYTRASITLHELLTWLHISTISVNNLLAQTGLAATRALVCVRACRGQLLFYCNHRYLVTVIVHDGWMITWPSFTWRLHDVLYEISDGDRISGTALNFCSENLSYGVGAFSEQTQHGFLSARFDVLQDNYKMVDWPFMFTRSNVQSVVQEKGLLSFWDCLIYYGKKFLDTGLVLSHICIKPFREMFSQGTDEESEVVPEPTEQPLMVLSSSAWSGTETATTLRFQGQIQHQDILVLIDSGSSHSFLGDRLRSELSGVQPLVTPITVQVASGQMITCCHHLPSAEWTMSGCYFSADHKCALRRFRRAKGLCERCTEKWNHDHKCGATAQLHAMDEVCNLFTDEEGSAPEEPPIEGHTEQLFMSVSYSAWSGTASHQTLKLKGSIQQQYLNILLDSGSTHTFVNDKLIPLLSGVQSISYPPKVQVANGTIVSGQYPWLQTHWQIQEYEFVTDLLFLPLPSYDMVIGMDWLATFSPMRVDWAQKWLAIPYKGSSIVLYGQSQTILSRQHGRMLQPYVPSSQPHQLGGKLALKGGGMLAFRRWTLKQLRKQTRTAMAGGVLQGAEGRIRRRLGRCGPHNRPCNELQ